MICETIHRVELKDVGVRYGKCSALTQVGFIIEEPTVIGIVGKNGSGKSTLLRIISGMEKPNLGSVMINGQKPYDNEKILRNIIFIDEKIEFDFTLSLSKILEKCAFMDERFNLEFARETAQKFGLINLTSSLVWLSIDLLR